MNCSGIALLLFALSVLVGCGMSRSSALSADLQEECRQHAQVALAKSLPEVDFSMLEMAVDFDCRESLLVDDLGEPVRTARKEFRDVLRLVEMIPIGFVRNSLDVLEPYCRTDNPIYGDFCMAGDVESARDMTNDPVALRALPRVVSALGASVRANEKIDFYEIVAQEMNGAGLEGRRRAALVASFLGLDDNATQADRLRANLIRQGRWEDYAAVLPATSQYLPATGVTRDFLSVLFATRTGIAVVPNLDPDATLTYKAYAGMYLGCKMAVQGAMRGLVLKEAHDIGMAYELMKVRQSQSADEFFRNLDHYRKRGETTGRRMRTGADYGFSLCRG